MDTQDFENNQDDGESPNAICPSSTVPELSSIAQSSQRAMGFPIVAIGASAGGLEAIEEFLAKVPANPGMAFVCIMHQRPGQASLLPELLGSKTSMKVQRAEDGIPLEPNVVYVNNPGTHLAVFNGVLHCIQDKSTKSPWLAIDYFFRSLAADQHKWSMGIILSGTGTDGTEGLKAIKGESGMVMAQEPASASFAGMPSSAINTGLVDYVLSPSQMPSQLIAYTNGPLLKSEKSEGHDQSFTLPDGVLSQVFLQLKRRTKEDFSSYKPSTIRRRIQRRMSVHHIYDPNHYLRYLQENPCEVDALFKELLINVTSFFRDQAAWDLLTRGPLRDLIQTRPENYTLRAWVPACATGEEVYTLAILIYECMELTNRHMDVQIFGTDLDSTAIEKARFGRYPEGIRADVPANYLEKYFVKEDGVFRIRQHIRELATFASQNVIRDPPFIKLDILCCRNLLIYLNSEIQSKLLPMFHHALRRDGLLFLGNSESIGSHDDLFETLNSRSKIFARTNTPTAGPFESLSNSVVVDHLHDGIGDKLSHGDASFAPRISVERSIEKAILAHHAPACIVTNARGDIVHIQGRLGSFLEPTAGQPRMNALEMAREGLELDLASAMREASQTDQPVRRENIRVKTNGDYGNVDISVLKIAYPESIQGLLLIAFFLSEPTTLSEDLQEVDPATDQTDVLNLQKREIEHLRQSYQAKTNELRSSNEQLKSMNEELQSTNEELNSSNEELETSKEEMQSLNEELRTVNAELQSKLQELAQANDDMQNLLNSTEIATIFLDDELNIMRFTESAKKLIRVRETDIGRPLSDLATQLKTDDLPRSCHEVIKTLTPIRSEVESEDGRPYMMRIMPYRTILNAVKGLVVTFVDMTELSLAQQSAAQRTYFENIFDTVRHSMAVLDQKLRIVSVNRAFADEFACPEERVVGQHFYELGGQEWNIPELRSILEEILPHNRILKDFEVEHEFAHLGYRKFVLNARRLEQAVGLPDLILLAFEDMTER
ncbi:PAS domain-containing protein [bacterium]|nr:PAS domain-containing protein [bacterium]